MRAKSLRRSAKGHLELGKEVRREEVRQEEQLLNSYKGQLY